MLVYLVYLNPMFYMVIYLARMFLSEKIASFNLIWNNSKQIPLNPLNHTVTIIIAYLNIQKPQNFLMECFVRGRSSIFNMLQRVKAHLTTSTS